MDKLQKFKEIAELLNRDVPSTREVAETIAKVIAAVKEARAHLEKQAKENKEELTEMVSESAERLDKDLQSVESSLEKKLDSLKNTLKTESREELDKKALEILREVREIRESIPSPTDLSDVLRQIEELKNKKPVTAEEVRDQLEALEGNERLDKKAIRGLEDDLIELRKSGAKILGGARGIQLYVDGVKKGQSQTINLIAGNNITITHSFAHGQNDIIITGGSGALTEIALTGTVDDSNTSFTAASEPTYLIINGAMYKKTGGSITWTYTTGDIELSVPVGTGGSIYGLS